jgi:dephospho-CoA kinase
MFRLGLTGSIGTGKSTTADIFRDLGVPVHDADAAVHRLYRDAAVPLIAREFPGAVIDGVIDRKSLGALVTGKPERFKALEAIVHPMVQAEEQIAIEKAKKAGHRLIVLDIPLLFETDSQNDCDAVLVTHVHPDEQRRRVLARGTMDEQLFESILARQIPLGEKRAMAHFSLDTGYGVEAARAEVIALLRALAPCLSGG